MKLLTVRTLRGSDGLRFVLRLQPCMGNLLWQSYADTGFHDVDLEHRAISRQVAALQGAVNGGDAGAAAEAVTQLIHQFVEHFTHEERLMADSRYPQAERHRAAHEGFLAYLRIFAEEFASKGLTPAFGRRACEHLPEALHAHITDHDAALGQHLLAWAARTG